MPNHSLAKRSMGQIYIRKGNFSKAIEFKLTALANDFNPPTYGRNSVIDLCINLYQLGFIEEGRKYSE